MRRARLRPALPALLALLASAAVASACGKKGPPLPPLVLLPNPPGEVAAVRRGERVDLSFTVPTANTDRSTPADLERIDVYAWTVPGAVSGDDIVRRGTRIASVVVNPPADPDEPEPKTPAPKGEGAEQNATVTVSDTVPPGLDPSAYRTYVAVGVNARGRRGALSRNVAVPLVPPPAPPPQPALTYDEKAISVTWGAVAAAPETPITYSVYRAGTEPAALTPTPGADTTFADTAIEWEQERCYEVRAVATIESVRIESAASPAHCVTLHDTFAPATPQGLVGVGSQGAVSLIWTANADADLAG
ncbi:MAG: hypothetical protein ABL982_24965, partial [Vicinamibacterales bacterium]